jgi:hypothetical protein
VQLIDAERAGEALEDHLAVRGQVEAGQLPFMPFSFPALNYLRGQPPAAATRNMSLSLAILELNFVSFISTIVTYLVIPE